MVNRKLLGISTSNVSSRSRRTPSSRRWRALFSIQCNFILQSSRGFFHYPANSSPRWTKKMLRIVSKFHEYKCMTLFLNHSCRFTLNNSGSGGFAHNNDLLIRQHHDARKLRKPNSHVDESLKTKFYIFLNILFDELK